MEARQTIDDYVLGEGLGEGRNTIVQVGSKDGAQWAVKYIKELPDKDKQNSLEFLVKNERDVMMRLKHDHILKLHDSSLTGVLKTTSSEPCHAMYLVFELMKNFDLYDLISYTGPLPETVARPFFLKLLSAVEYLHTQGYLHRDIKLMNVLIDNHYDPKLADFGTACVRPEDGHILGKIGTPSILPFEASSSVPYDGVKADIFALGVLLFTIVMGQPPFHHSKDDLYRVFCTRNRLFWKRVTSTQTPSDEFKALVNSLLAMNPQKRPSIADIKVHSWSQGPTAPPAEVQAELAAREVRVKERKTPIQVQALTIEPTLGGLKPAAVGFQPHSTGPMM